MAYSSTVNADIATTWRKVQGDMYDGINFKCEELQALDEDVPNMKIAPSLREMTFPVRLSISGGVTSLSEGGRLAVPTTSMPVDATVAFIHKNARFTISQLAQWASMDSMAREAEITSQLKYQGMDKIDSLAADVSDRFWGFSDGVVSTTTTAGTQASGQYTVTNGFGSSTITNSAYILAMYQVGEYVALIRSGALVTNAIGLITGKTVSGINVTWAGSVTSVSGDKIVKANGANATTIAHTSYNKDMTGMLDFATSTSVHGISGTTYPGWNPAHSDTTAGRFNGQKLRKGLDKISNTSGASRPRSVTLWTSQGVLRDLQAQLSAGLRFDNPNNLELDADVKARGKQFRTSRRVPPGYVFAINDGVIRKKVIKDRPDKAPLWGDLYEPQDDAFLIGRIDYALLTATPSRAGIAVWSNQTES